VTVDRSALPDSEKERVLSRLAELLQLDAVELGERMEDRKYYAFQPIPIAFDVPQSVASYIGEHQEDLPGVSYVPGSVREYPYKNLGAHLLGYTGEISSEQLELPRFKDYNQGALIGKAGVEAVYEEDLQGVEGLVKYEVNAQGDIIRPLGPREPVPGDDLVLSIDAGVQRVTQRSLREGMEQARNIFDREDGYLKAGGGAALVMDPRNGQVLAMASFPTFDPATFIGGITQKEFKRLIGEGSNSPLYNRAIQSALPPGSTFKPFVAAAAVQERITNLNAYTPCPSEFGPLPNDPTETTFGNWQDVDRPPLNLAEALIESCDTVFYEFGHEFYKRRVTRGEVFQKHLERFGFGRPTGVDLPNENPGLIPDREYKEKTSRTNQYVEPVWFPGDDIIMAIGQGLVQVSPIQLATAMSAIANGGTIWQPHLGLRVQKADGDVVRQIKAKKLGRLPFSKNVLGYIRDSLARVTSSGTAAGAFAGFPLSQYSVAGKTGTAEMPPRQDFSWFAAMTPANGAKYVVVAMVEEGGHGSSTAAPIVRAIIEGLYGIERTEPIAPPEATD
jgi:penicillin-binding protein 2